MIPWSWPPARPPSTGWRGCWPSRRTVPIRWWEWVVLGVLIGVAALSKLQGLGLIPLAGLAVLFLGWRRRSWRLVLQAALCVAVPAAGDCRLVVRAQHHALRGLERPGPSDVDQRAPHGAADAGGFLAGVSRAALFVLGTLWLVQHPAAGLVLPGGRPADGGGGGRRRGRSWSRPYGRSPPPLADQARLRVLVLLLAWAALIFLLLIYWTLQATGSQGRLIFPGMIAYGILLPLGVDFWLQWLPAPAALGGVGGHARRAGGHVRAMRLLSLLPALQCAAAGSGAA